ncbi:MAG: acyltransferase family protein, partial [Ilumatobacteraceae bacterium]
LAMLRSVPGSDFAAWFGSIGSPALPGRDFGRILLSTQIPTFAFAFASGMSVASISSRRRARGLAASPPRGSHMLVPVGVLSSLVMLWVLGSIERDQGLSDPFLLVRSEVPEAVLFYFAQHVAPVVGFALVLAGLVLDQRPHRIIGAPPLRVVGILGYGIYLWHFPVIFSQTGIKWIYQLEPALQFPVATAVGAATTVGLSLITWFAIERPWMARGKRTARALADSPSEASTTAHSSHLVDGTSR